MLTSEKGIRHRRRWYIEQVAVFGQMKFDRHTADSDTSARTRSPWRTPGYLAFFPNHSA